jgi:hypothetical protein
VTLGSILTGFKALCEDIAGIGPDLEGPEVDAPVDGAEQAGRHPSPAGVLVKIKPIRCMKIGHDEIRTEHVADIGDGKSGFTRSSFGNRVVSIKIVVEQDDGTDNGLAFPIAENIRSRLELPTNLERLSNIGIGISEFSDIEASEEVEEDRAYPAAFFVAVFNTTVSYDDEPVEDIQTVNTEYVPPA